MKLIIPIIAVACMASCAAPKKTAKSLQNFPSFYKEGHRGTRGLMPENTIPAMVRGIEVGANIIEVDVYVSKDGQVFIAHDPFLNPGISLLPGGHTVSKDSAKLYTWHQMNYEEIRKIDVGLKPNPAFPQQARVAAWMPLLGELIDSVEAFSSGKNIPSVIYNIEIKSYPEKDGVYQPVPDVLVRAVMDVVQSKKIGRRFYLQSFDVRVLRAARKQYPNVVIGFLTGESKKSLSQNIQELGFWPDIYSPAYKLVDRVMVVECSKSGMKLVPWTVNTKAEIDQLVQLGVDGIITDYPNLLKEL